jgi:hypothetical protein
MLQHSTKGTHPQLEPPSQPEARRTELRPACVNARHSSRMPSIQHATYNIGDLPVMHRLVLHDAASADDDRPAAQPPNQTQRVAP